MRFWLFKSEPESFSWDMLKTKGAAGQEWDGVRNYQARNNMRLMQLGDRAFFYHSNEGLAVVGIAEVCALSHPDASAGEDTRWDCVDIRAVADMPRPVPLAAVKANPLLSQMPLLTSFRLSVQPVAEAEWREVCRMGGLAD
jgi:predicted RNA-binding protein with PUA-like domain